MFDFIIFILFFLLFMGLLSYSVIATLKIKKLIKKFCTKEIIFYVIFGVFTTIVNVGSFYVMNKIWDWNEDLSNFIAIVLAVLFAYVTNQDLVFHSDAKNFKEKLNQFFSQQIF